MNVLIGTSSAYGKGAGINTYVMEIASELLRRGCSVIVAGPPPEEANLDKIEFIECGQETSPIIAVKRLHEVIKRNRLDLIINNDNPFLQCVCPIAECTFISVMHLGMTNIASLATFNGRWIDYIVTISNDMRYRAMRSTHVLGAHRFPVIYNGIAPPGELEDDQDLQVSGPLKVIYNGGMTRRKGYDLFAKSLLEYSELWKDVEVHVFGSVSEKEKKRLSQIGNIRVHGRVPRREMYAALQGADVFLLPSRAEGCPMALIEAMSLGLIPIVSDGDGAMDEMVESGVNGFVCPIRSWPQDCAEVIAYLASNMEVCDQLKVASKRTYVDRFTAEKLVDNLMLLSARPTVSRSSRPRTIDVLRWHRPFKAGSRVAPLLDRLAIKTGYLRIWRRGYVVDGN